MPRRLTIERLGGRRTGSIWTPLVMGCYGVTLRKDGGRLYIGRMRTVTRLMLEMYSLRLGLAANTPAVGDVVFDPDGRKVEVSRRG